MSHKLQYKSSFFFPVVLLILASHEPTIEVKVFVGFVSLPLFLSDRK